MTSQAKAWSAEVERRAAIYDDPGESDVGRLGPADYLGMTVLAFGLLLAFWVWAV